jgi:hypothetical protein
VTRGTRPKKPSSHGFACEARGARGVGGFGGLKTENQNFFPLFSSKQQLPKIKIKIFIFTYFSSSVRADKDAARVREGGRRASEGDVEEGGEVRCVRGLAASARTQSRVRADAKEGARRARGVGGKEGGRSDLSLR